MASYLGYARVSTREQSDYSIEDQLKYLERRASELTLPFTPYSEKESAFKLAEDRTLLWDEVIPALKPGDVLGVFDYSRLSRKGSAEARKIADEIIKKGAKVQISGVFYDPADPDSDFLFDIHTTVAKYYLAIQRKKSLTGIRQKRENGDWVLTGRLYGYTIQHLPNSKKTISINQAEAEVIRLLFTRYIGGESLNSLTGYLNRQGIPSSTEKKFVPRTIQRMLLNPIYAGYYLLHPPMSGGKRVNLGKKGLGLEDLIKSNVYPPIITLETYFRCLDSYREVRRTRSRVAEYRWRGYLLTGLIHCENCQTLGTKTVFVHGWSKPINSKTINPVYTSRTHQPGCGCKFRTLREEVFNELVRLTLIVFFADRDRISRFTKDKVDSYESEIQSENKRISSIAKEIESLGSKISKAEDQLQTILSKSLDEGTYDTSTQERTALLRLIKGLEDQKDSQERKKAQLVADSRIINAELEAGRNISDILANYSERIALEFSENSLLDFQASDAGNRRNILLKFIDHITVHDTYFKILFIDGLAIAYQLEKNRGRLIQRAFHGTAIEKSGRTYPLIADTVKSRISIDTTGQDRATIERAHFINSEIARLLAFSKEATTNP